MFKLKVKSEENYHLTQRQHLIEDFGATQLEDKIAKLNDNESGPKILFDP